MNTVPSAEYVKIINMMFELKVYEELKIDEMKKIEKNVNGFLNNEIDFAD